MINDIKLLKAYALNRRLPAVIYLGSLPQEWISYANDICKKLPDSSEEMYSERVEKKLKGTELKSYSHVTKNYKQKRIIDESIFSNIFKFKNVSHLRFAILDSNSSIDFHLDDPTTYRFIFMVSGSHKYYHENQEESLIMKEGEFWFVNGSFKHSIINDNGFPRIAILGNFEINEYNKNMLNELLRTRT
jgi:hypothetical protein